MVALTPTNASVPNASSMFSTAPVGEKKEMYRSGKGVRLYLKTILVDQGCTCI